MIKNFGAAYTLKNIDDEPYVELQLMQICLNAVNKAEEMANKKATYQSKEFI
jgi:hypothetical protein